MKTLILILFILAPFFSFAEECTPNVNSCGYYLCEEKNQRCGPKGYPLGFGFRFCQKFLTNEADYSDETRAWLPKVRMCLMQDLKRAANDSGAKTCGEVRSEAFRGHIECYTETGFCELSLADKLHISWGLRNSFVIPEVVWDAFLVNLECAKREPNPVSPIEPK